MAPTGDASLNSWNDIATLRSWDSIVLGNGASQAVWRRFAYSSLFDVAKTAGTAAPLSSADCDLFAALGAQANFEAVLGALLTARTVGQALNHATAALDERYRSISEALVAAVHHVHVPWAVLDRARLLRIRTALASHEWVFSTNYDLLLYWAVMAQEANDFRDYFWNGAFDVTDTEIRGEATKILYLHGGLHLYHDPRTAQTYKEKAQEGKTLLDLFGKRTGGVPLCITEGSSEQKLTAIRRSDYLQFALHTFSEVQGPIVVFGHSLGDADRHIVDLLAKKRDRTIAISVYPSDREGIVKAKAFCRQRLPSADLHFFDSTTHPLGTPDLIVSDDAPAQSALAG